MQQPLAGLRQDRLPGVCGRQGASRALRQVVPPLPAYRCQFSCRSLQAHATVAITIPAITVNMLAKQATKR